jgi:hypothetical protein
MYHQHAPGGKNLLLTVSKSCRNRAFVQTLQSMRDSFGYVLLGNGLFGVEDGAKGVEGEETRKSGTGHSERMDH